tara:strand:+ start:169 stop:579 length:411 start_codon:yes stop_codon:yes gene_type:complete
MTKDQQRFEEIISEIDNLMEEAINIIPENMVARAKSYWYAHIMCAINDDHEFIGGSPHHMQDALDEWMESTTHRPTGFMNQADEDDYAARNPYRNYCLECGKDFSSFMHNCSETINYNEVYGCSSCDDHCGSCNAQ